MSPDWMSAPLRAWRASSLRRALRAVASLLLRACAALLGLAFMLGMLLLGLVAGSLLLLWALLRGRRPALRFGGMPPGAGWQRFRAAPPRASSGEVVDIEAREIKSPGQG
ncbi:MAG TPA: hypothetical protein VLI72_02105 [Methylibium sp.]|nr:hypothetical protein [Methylibium sp.]